MNSNKFKILALVFFVLLIGVAVNPLSSKETSKVCPKITKLIQTVTMKEDSFEPETLTIQRCTRIVFKNQDKISRWPASNLHPTHGIYPEFDPKEPIEVGKEWSFVFDKSGRWKYHDHLVPFIRALIDVSD